MDRYLGCFHFLTIMNNAAINIVYTMEYHSTIKKKEVLSFVTTGMGLEGYYAK